MVCSKTYFKETLSMCYINFLAKMPLLTNCYIRLKKVDMKPDSN